MKKRYKERIWKQAKRIWAWKWHTKTLFIIFIISVIFFLFLIFKTGLIFKGQIDKRDLSYWNYNEKGVIVGAEGFEIQGNKETCWLLIHSYSSTPIEMKEVSEIINHEFGDFVFVLRLEGHGEVPSHITNLSLNGWYKQVEKDFDLLKSECDNVNVVGNSFGGALTLKLAEQKDLKNVYLSNAYIKPRDKWFYGMPLRFYINYFSDYLIYIEKLKVGQINDPEGLKKHIAYRNFPMQPVKNSFEFLDIGINETWKVTEPILILHSPNDITADYDIMNEIIEDVSSDVKELKKFPKSNHILLLDYDKEEVIKSIIEFERENR